MTHVRELIHRSLEGDVAPAERTHLDEHLRTCERCRQLSTELRRNDVLLAKREPMPAVPPQREPLRHPLALVHPLLVGVATLAFALLVGTQLAGWRASTGPASSSVPAPTSGITVLGPLALAGSSPSEGFGLISTSANELLVRSEARDRAQLVIPGGLPQLAVSPSGKDLAYWRAGTDAKTGAPYFALHVTDVIDAIGAADANGRLGATVGLTYLTSTDESPFAVRWSSDGTGLIAGTRTPLRRGPLASPQRDHLTWFAIDLATRKVDRLAGLDEMTAVYAWDRQRDLITGSGIVANEPAFITVTAGRVASHAVPRGSLITAADALGRSVVLVAAGDKCADGSGWPCPLVEIRDQATFTTTAILPRVGPTTDYPDVQFRPRSQDLIVQLPLPNGEARVELWSDLGRGPHRVLASFTQSGRSTARREAIIPRVDGGAVFVLKFDDSQGGRWFGQIMSLSDASQTPFEIRTGGNPLASVVLDPAFARALAPSRPTAVASPRPTPAIPKCSYGQLPVLDVTDRPPPGSVPGSGSPSAEAAFREARPDLTSFDMYPFGSDQKARSASELGKLVWIVAGEETFIAQVVGRSDGNDWFAYPAKFAGCRAPSPESLRTWVAESALNVEGYGFSVRIMSDPAYGPQPSAGPWAVSAVPGIGLSCTWTRTGPDIATVQDLWGTPQSVASTAGYTDVRTGRGGTRQNGIPLAAVTGSTATTVCGVRDAAGPHGVVIELAIAPDGKYTDASLRLSQWSGVAAEATPSPSATPRALGPITPADVAAGMPAGAAIFARTDPTCVLDTDGKTYRCVLGSPPAPEISDFLGTKELLVIGGAVAGGCVGLGHDGMTWNCFIGQEAVDSGIIGKDLLGQPAPVPGRG